MLCQDIPEGKWKTMIVKKKNHARHAQGYWQGMTSTESQEFTYHVGISETSALVEDESEDHVCKEKKLITAMEAGIDHDELEYTTE